MGTYEPNSVTNTGTGMQVLTAEDTENAAFTGSANELDASNNQSLKTEGPIRMMIVLHYGWFAVVLLVGAAVEQVSLASRATLIGLYLSVAFFSVQCERFVRAVLGSFKHPVLPIYLTLVPYFAFALAARAARISFSLLWLLSALSIVLHCGSTDIDGHILLFCLLFASVYTLAAAMVYTGSPLCIFSTSNATILPDLEPVSSTLSSDYVFGVVLLIAYIFSIAVRQYVAAYTNKLVESNLKARAYMDENSAIYSQLMHYPTGAASPFGNSNAVNANTDPDVLDSPVTRAIKLVTAIIARYENVPEAAEVVENLAFAVHLLRSNKLFKVDLVKAPKPTAAQSTAENKDEATSTAHSNGSAEIRKSASLPQIGSTSLNNMDKQQNSASSRLNTRRWSDGHQLQHMNNSKDSEVASNQLQSRQSQENSRSEASKTSEQTQPSAVLAFGGTNAVVDAEVKTWLDNLMISKESDVPGPPPIPIMVATAAASSASNSGGAVSVSSNAFTASTNISTNSASGALNSSLNGSNKPRRLSAANFPPVSNGAFNFTRAMRGSISTSIASGASANVHQDASSRSITSHTTPTNSSHVPSSERGLDGGKGHSKSLSSLDACSLATAGTALTNPANAAAGMGEGASVPNIGFGVDQSALATEAGAIEEEQQIDLAPGANAAEVSRHLLLADSWEFDCFELARLTNGRPLYHLMRYMFDFYEFEALFSFDPAKVNTFLRSVEANYRLNPYHNAIHATDVTQTMFYFLHTLRLGETVAAEELLAALLAASVHDVDHPGVNSAFLIETKSYLALRYNDQAVLENHHASKAFELLLHPDANFLAVLPVSKRKTVRQCMLKMVLATDMGRHFEFITKFQNKVHGEGLNLGDPKDRQLLLEMSIKCADVSNPAKAPQLSQKWAELVMAEFFLQGDQEALRGIPVSKFMDRRTALVSKCQIGFIDFIVAPLFRVWDEYVNSEGGFVGVDNIETNKKFWTEYIDTPPPGIGPHVISPIETPEYLQPSMLKPLNIAATPPSFVHTETVCRGV